jgi:hypothetical protein
MIRMIRMIRMMGQPGKYQAEGGSARCRGLVLALFLAAAAGLAAQDSGGGDVATGGGATDDGGQPSSSATGPVYSLSADAAAGFMLAADGFDPAVAGSAALWSVGANFLHRIEAPGWGMVLSHKLDLSGLSSSAPVFTPALTVYEAYARLDVGDWGQLFIGKRRMGLGIGTTFAPGDAIDPRSGFWDQKNGFRGVDLSASLGPDVALRGAMSLDGNFDAYAAGLAAKAALAAAKAAAEAAYAAALGPAAGPADPRLVVWALSTDAQLGAFQLSAAGVYQPDRVERPSLGASLDLGGVILQAEGAVELSGAPDWYGTGGARYTWSYDASSLTLSCDYDYNGKAGALLKRSHYLLPYLGYTRDEVLNVYARALVEVEAPSALLAAGLTLYPTQGFDVEFTGSLALGDGAREFAAQSAQSMPPSPVAGGNLSASVGLAARVHF